MILAQAAQTEIWKQLVPSPAAWVCLAVIAGVLIWLVCRFRAVWRDDSDRDASPHQMLVQFQESEREGVLTAEEYRLIKSRLLQRIKPTTETERQRSAEKSTDPAKEIAATNTPQPEAGGMNTRTDQPT